MSERLFSLVWRMVMAMLYVALVLWGAGSSVALVHAGACWVLAVLSGYGFVRVLDDVLDLCGVGAEEPPRKGGE